MVIEKNLPFECCETCQNFVLDTNEQVISSFNEVGQRILTIGCHNDWLCKQLREQFVKEEEGNG